MSTVRCQSGSSPRLVSRPTSQQMSFDGRPTIETSGERAKVVAGGVGRTAGRQHVLLACQEAVPKVSDGSTVPFRTFIRLQLSFPKLPNVQAFLSAELKRRRKPQQKSQARYHRCRYPTGTSLGRHGRYRCQPSRPGAVSSMSPSCLHELGAHSHCLVR